MTAAVLFKLLAILATIATGWVAARRGWIGGRGLDKVAAARLLSDLAFTVFVPALLFRATARLDLGALPAPMLAAFFVPALGLLAAAYALARRRGGQPPEAAATTALTASFGNSVQLGIPVAAALFGEAGLALHVALVSLHALALLLPATLAAELALARRHSPAAAPSLLQGVARLLRQTLAHPVLLPIVAGFAFNLSGLAIPGWLDEVLLLLGSAVVPLCLVLIGISLAAYDVRAHWRGALGLVAAKLVLLPALVLGFAHGVLGLDGLPLAVVVMMAALPVGANPLIFAQRYPDAAGRGEARATSAIVVSTLLYALAAAVWLAVLSATGWRG